MFVLMIVDGILEALIDDLPTLNALLGEISRRFPNVKVRHYAP